jgi:hypothetical protein
MDQVQNFVVTRSNKLTETRDINERIMVAVLVTVDTVHSLL